MTSFLKRASAVAAALLVLGCGSDGPSAPVPGPLRVVLTSPNTGDGAVMFQVIGVVDSAIVPAGVSVYQSTPGSNVIRAIATGTLSTGSNLLTLYVPDVGTASNYTTQVLQVAAAGTYAQRAVGGYRVAVRK